MFNSLLKPTKNTRATEIGCSYKSSLSTMTRNRKTGILALQGFLSLGEASEDEDGDGDDEDDAGGADDAGDDHEPNACSLLFFPNQEDDHENHDA